LVEASSLSLGQRSLLALSPGSPQIKASPSFHQSATMDASIEARPLKDKAQAVQKASETIQDHSKSKYLVIAVSVLALTFIMTLLNR